jgi:ABC-type multidrug transport system fused ATPase/permease subunit
VDPATEIVLSAALDRLIEGRTAIIIAHRLATVAHVDEIIVLEHGRVVEHGPRADLAASPDSLFAHLLETAKDGLIRDEVQL